MWVLYLQFTPTWATVDALSISRILFLASSVFGSGPEFNVLVNSVNILEHSSFNFLEGSCCVDRGMSAILYFTKKRKFEPRISSIF